MADQPHRFKAIPGTAFGSEERKVSLLWIDGGSKPELTSPNLDRWAMGQTLVRHARKHFEFFEQHTPGFGARVDSETKAIVPVVWDGTPLPASDILLLELEVKHAVEDLRSALEYLAMEVFERMCCQSSDPQPHVHREVTFPVPTPAETADEFAEKIERILPGLRSANKPIFDLVLGCRSYVVGENVWLDTINNSWMEVKHRRLASSTKPMKILVPGTDPAVAPEVKILYFPGTSRAVSPNLSKAIDGVQSLLDRAEALVDTGAAA